MMFGKTHKLDERLETLLYAAVPFYQEHYRIKLSDMPESKAVMKAPDAEQRELLMQAWRELMRMRGGSAREWSRYETLSNASYSSASRHFSKVSARMR